MQKKKRGGKRKGAGRPKKEKTKVIRVPVSKIEQIKKTILFFQDEAYELKTKNQK